MSTNRIDAEEIAASVPGRVHVRIGRNAKRGQPKARAGLFIALFKGARYISPVQSDRDYAHEQSKARLVECGMGLLAVTTKHEIRVKPPRK
jgi:hypothetical protein